MAKTLPQQNTLNAFLTKMFAYLTNKSISIPESFREKCFAVQDALDCDKTGLANSVLDFAITSGQVDFSVETSNDTLTKIFSSWINNINADLLGKIPVGINQLAKEYYRERWKGSSFILLRTIWEEKDGFKLPTKMWFVDGKDILLENTSLAKELGKERYSLYLSQNKNVSLPASKTEKIFIQKPFERWDSMEVTPFLIKRGVYYNMKFLQMLMDKGENLVGKALEYLMLMKKGSVDLVKMNKPEYTYSQEDLKEIKAGFEQMLEDKKSLQGIPSYYTNFDTEIEHLIPEYTRIVQEALYAPFQRNILSGLGFVDVIEGVSSSRKESILNPRLFSFEVQQGVNDFKSIISDILKTILIENSVSHKKYTNVDYIQVRSTPVKSFMTEDAKTLLRSYYDRGMLSKRTAVEIGLDIDFDAEVERRKVEKEKGYEKLMFAPVIQNNGNISNSASPSDENLPDSKKGPEATDFNKASYEEAPYKNPGDLPDSIKDNMTVELQKVFVEVFNKTYEKKGEDVAFKTAWSVIKKIAKKDKDGKWIQKKKMSSAAIEELAGEYSTVEELKLEVLQKQQKVLDKLLHEDTKSE